MFCLRFQNPDKILEAFNELFRSQEGDFSTEFNALAAAEVVAAKFGQPSQDFPDDPDAWQDLEKLPIDVSLDCVNLALKTVRQIKAESDLRNANLTSVDPNDYPEWIEIIDDLIDRLTKAL